jgi:hypothetical protein
LLVFSVSTARTPVERFVLGPVRLKLSGGEASLAVTVYVPSSSAVSGWPYGVRLNCEAGPSVTVIVAGGEWRIRRRDRLGGLLQEYELAA